MTLTADFFDQGNDKEFPLKIISIERERQRERDRDRGKLEEEKQLGLLTS